MRRRPHASDRSPAVLVATLLCVGAAGCATLGQIAALRDVDFRIDRLAGLHVAGVDVSDVSTWEELELTDVARVTMAVAGGELPVEFRLHLVALNPEDNVTDARLVRMDWTLFLQDRETLSGVFDGDVVLPPGEPRDVPIPIRIDLARFFDGGAQDLVQLALSLAGQDADPVDVALRATPVVDTPLGPIRYPRPITIVHRVGGGR